MSNCMSIQDGAVKREIARAMGEALLKRNGYESGKGLLKHVINVLGKSA